MTESKLCAKKFQRTWCCLLTLEVELLALLESLVEFSLLDAWKVSSSKIWGEFSWVETGLSVVSPEFSEEFGLGHSSGICKMFLKRVTQLTTKCFSFMVISMPLFRILSRWLRTDLAVLGSKKRLLISLKCCLSSYIVCAPSSLLSTLTLAKRHSNGVVKSANNL